MRSWIFLLLTLSCAPHVIFSQPRLELEKTSIDYGKFRYGGSNLISEFRVKNTGNEPLIITRVGTGDGGFMCKSYPKEPIQPNKTAVIQFLYDTKRIGRFTKTGYIQSNSLEENQTITIRGEIIPAPVIYFTQKELNLGTIKAGEYSSFELYNYGTAPLILSKIVPKNHSIPMTFLKDTVGVYESMELTFCPKVIHGKSEFDLEWEVFSNASIDLTNIRAWGKIDYSPLVMDTNSIPIGNSSSVTHFFKINCFNESEEEIEVFRISKDINPENIWFPTEQIYYNQGKTYTIPGKTSTELLVAYQLYNYYPHNEKVYIYSRNKKTGKEYLNFITLN